MARRWEHKRYLYFLIKISTDTIRLWNHNNEEHSGVDISKIGKVLIELGQQSMNIIILWKLHESLFSSGVIWRKNRTTFMEVCSPTIS